MRRYLSAAIAAAALIIVAIVIGTQSGPDRTVTADVQPTPTPGGASTGQVTLPDSERPDFVFIPPSFSDKVLHWSQTSFTFTPGSTSPANGEQVSGDIWVRMGADGLPTAFHGIYTLADGSLYQEILETPESSTITTLPAMAPKSPAGDALCTRQASSTPQAMRTLAPLFADENALPRAGYAVVGSGVTKPLPTKRASIEASPITVYTVDGQVRRWERREPAGGGAVSVTAIEVAGDGRVVVDQGRRVDSQGSVLSERWAAFGPLEVYDAAAVPTSVFSLRQEGCNA